MMNIKIIPILQLLVLGGFLVGSYFGDDLLTSIHLLITALVLSTMIDIIEYDLYKNAEDDK